MAYYPDAEVLNRALKMSTWVDDVVVVDNTPGGSPLFSGPPPLNVRYILNMNNAGIAAALNQGVEKLFSLGCAFAFLFDQDSEPDELFFQSIKSGFARAGKVSDKTAQMAPAYFDLRMQQIAPFIRVEGLRVRRIAAAGDELICADYVITSGACVSKAAWKAIGPMDESLFIDCVDIEWGLRAKAKGWQTYALPSVVMRHCLGEEPLQVFGRKFPLHTPLRHYYFFRNTVALLKRGYIPVGWKVVELYKLPLRFFVYTIFAEHGAKHAAMMLKGVLHGVIGKMGRMDG
ncbi:glycosyltransferase family 2 protein [Chitinolyticbacter albus]|uniref:glycosyltransferase family 2 protein n=1 Tax=Chitinolyticbacter albus TaxID=2961951 RepID=UPI002108E817|nr:glycosyltransferase family 2 protein [Chitinolyticbacter albus]